jgi:hypothetical protein
MQARRFVGISDFNLLQSIVDSVRLSRQATCAPYLQPDRIRQANLAVRHVPGKPGLPLLAFRGRKLRRDPGRSLPERPQSNVHHCDQGDPIMAYKKLVNQSGLALSIQFVSRQGSDPSQSGPIVTVSLPAGGKQTVEYGNPQNPYLNGLVVSSSSDGAFSNGSQIVTSRGSSWDNVLNTNDTLTFSGAGGLNVTGSNT